MSKVFDTYATYYDLLYKDKDYVQEADYIQDLLSENGVTKGSILELGCGTGKHAELLAGMGFNVHGIDMSLAMVKEANKRKSVELSEQLCFEVGDVRTYSGPEQFDAVVSLFHVASYQTSNEDLAAMFATASKQLKPGGVFIFDFWHGPGVISDKPSISIKRFENEDIHVTRIAEPEMVCSDNVVHVNYSIDVENKESKEVEKISECHSMRYLFQPEIEALCKSNSMKLEVVNKWLHKEKAGYLDWLGVVVIKRETF